MNEESTAISRICWGTDITVEEKPIPLSYCKKLNYKMKAKGSAFKFWERTFLLPWKEVLDVQWALTHTLITAERCTWSHPKITSLPTFWKKKPVRSIWRTEEQSCCCIPRCTKGFKVTNCISSRKGGLVYWLMQMSQFSQLSSTNFFFFNGGLSKMIFKGVLLNVFFVYIIYAHINKDMGKKIIDNQWVCLGQQCIMMSQIR